MQFCVKFSKWLDLGLTFQRGAATLLVIPRGYATAKHICNMPQINLQAMFSFEFFFKGELYNLARLSSTVEHFHFALFLKLSLARLNIIKYLRKILGHYKHNELKKPFYSFDKIRIKLVKWKSILIGWRSDDALRDLRFANSVEVKSSNSKQNEYLVKEYNMAAAGVTRVSNHCDHKLIKNSD